MRQKVQDLVLLFKHDKRYQVGLGGVILAVVLSLYLGENNARIPREKIVKNPTEALSQKEAYRDLVSSITTDMRNISESTTKNSGEIAKIYVRMEEDREKTVRIFKKITRSINIIYLLCGEMLWKFVNFKVKVSRYIR